MNLDQFRQRGPFEWEMPRHGAMRVPGVIFASRELLEALDAKVGEQLATVAGLPGTRIIHLPSSVATVPLHSACFRISTIRVRSSSVNRAAPVAAATVSRRRSMPQTVTPPTVSSPPAKPLPAKL